MVRAIKRKSICQLWHLHQLSDRKNPFLPPISGIGVSSSDLSFTGGPWHLNYFQRILLWRGLWRCSWNMLNFSSIGTTAMVLPILGPLCFPYQVSFHLLIWLLITLLHNVPVSWFYYRQCWFLVLVYYHNIWLIKQHSLVCFDGKIL